MKTLMILGASILQVPAIEKAIDMGLQVVALDMNPNAVGFEIPGVEKEIISTIDTPRIIEAAKKHRIDGIMTLASDMPMRSIARVCRELGLVGITEDTAFKATNKALMLDALKAANVPVPLYFRVKGLEDFKKAVDQVEAAGYKCIVKPADNSGSRGVDLLKEDYDILKAYDYSIQYSRCGELIVEEFMEGPEVSVETLTIDGETHVIQITDKLTTGAPYFVEIGHSQPSQLSDEKCTLISKAAVAANKALGIQTGPSHTEIIVTKDGPKIVEIGARLGGDCITTHLVPLSTGLNMVEMCIRLSIGEELKNSELTPLLNKGSAIRFIHSEPGILQSINGIDDVLCNQSIKQICITKPVGSEIDSLHNSLDRIGYVISNMEEPADAIKECENAISLLEVVVK